MTAQSPLVFNITRSTKPRPQAEREAILANPGFGKHFTDHMVSIDWSIDKGWYDAQVRPYGPLMLDPAASVLHYAQEIFEGLKAYRHADGSVWTFRPRANASRMQRSAHRLALPELPTDLFVEAIKQLVSIDVDWVPSAPETSLYLRPFTIANESFLGVRSAQQAAFYVIASPAGAYFAKGVAPVSICSPWNMRVQHMVVPVQQNAVATMPPRFCHNKKPTKTDVPKCCSWIRSRVSISKNSVE